MKRKFSEMNENSDKFSFIWIKCSYHNVKQERDEDRQQAEKAKYQKSDAEQLGALRCRHIEPRCPLYSHFFF